MRKDISKKLVETPRRKRWGECAVRGFRRKANNPFDESVPYKATGKRVAKEWDGDRSQTEYFAPLRGFLKKAVGRAWNDVNSEIRALLSPNKTTHKHVLDHLYRDFVVLKPLWDNKTPLHTTYASRNLPLRKGTFYVDKHGILRVVSKDHYLRPKTAEDPNVVPISDDAEYRAIDGVWYYITLDIFVQDMRFMSLATNTAPHFIRSRRISNKPPSYVYVYAKAKRQLSSKEIRLAKLPKVSK